MSVWPNRSAENQAAQEKVGPTNGARVAQECRDLTPLRRTRPGMGRGDKRQSYRFPSGFIVTYSHSPECTNRAMNRICPV